MKDIDFDELDLAVSSVLGQTVSSSDDATEVKDAAPLPATNAPEKASAEKTAPAVEATTSRPSRPKATPGSLAAKRRGRFMDVMHPSATMMPASNNESAKPALAGHAAVALQPLSPAIEADATPAEAVAPSPSVDEAPAEPTAELDESQTLIGAEPVPMESPVVEVPAPSDLSVVPADEPATDSYLTEQSVTVPAFDANVDTIVDPNTTVAPADTEPEVVDPASTSLATTMSQETPFLTDTKVDKRPLGGPGSAGDGSADLSAETPGSPQDTQSAPTAPLPRELQSDVVEVESPRDDNSTDAGSTPLFATNVAAAADLDDDGRVEGHPVFDTSTYHEPIAAVHDSAMSTWVKWVLGLAVCLALGAGVGYFLFTTGF